MKTKTKFAWAILVILVMPFLFVFSACGDDKDAEVKIALTDQTVTISADTTLVYNGQEQRPKVKVSASKPKAQVFEQGVDYEIIWAENESVNVKTQTSEGGSNYHYTIKALSTSKKLEGEIEKTYYISPLYLANTSTDVGVEVEETVFDINNGLNAPYTPQVKVKSLQSGVYLDNSLFNFTFSGNTQPTKNAMVSISPKDENSKNIKDSKNVKFEIKKANISNATITFGESDQSYSTFYTGEKITVDNILKVFYRTDENGEKIYLPLGTNPDADTPELKYGYTLTYESNTAVGTAKVKIEALADNPYLEGSVVKTFSIEPCTFDDENFSILIDNQQNKNFHYTSFELTPTITVKSSQISANDGVVSSNVYDKKYYYYKQSQNDQEGTWETCGEIKNVGQYKVEISAKANGNFDGTISKEFKVEETDITGGTITFSGQNEFSHIFTGHAIEPDVKFTINIDGKNFDFQKANSQAPLSFVFTNQINVGNDLTQPTITVSAVAGKGFSGTALKTFTITAVDLSNENNGVSLLDKSGHSIQALDNPVFNNTQQTPEFDLQYAPANLTTNAYVLQQDDVTITYDNVTFGTCNVTISGNGQNFVGTMSTSFEILPANIEDANFASFEPKDYDFGNEITLSASETTATFEGAGTTPYALVFEGTENDDFALTYNSNTESGTATVTITGQNHFEGTITKTFEINPIPYTTQSDDENLNAILKNDNTFDLIGNPNFTDITVATKNVVVNSDSKKLLDTQQIVVETGASLTLNTFVGSNITNENQDTIPDFEGLDPENFEFSIVQNNISSKFELESAMKFAGSLKLSQDILEAVELLKAFQNSNSNQDSQVAVRKIDLNGFGLLGSDNSTSSNLVVDTNAMENLSVFLYLTNSSETPSFVGSNNTNYGLDIHAGQYSGSDQSFKSFDFAMMANKVTFQGKYGGILTQGNYSNTFDFENENPETQGKMFLMDFENCNFKSLNETQTVGQSQTYPASAVLLANAVANFENCTFEGASGIFVNAGQNGFSNSTITATSQNSVMFSKTFGALGNFGFGTGSGLVVQNKGSTLLVDVQNTTITSKSHYAVEEFKSSDKTTLQEGSGISLSDVTLNSGATSQFSLADQQKRGTTESTNILTSSNVVVNPTSDESINNALLNDRYEQTIINQVNIKSDYTESYNHKEIYAGKVMLTNNATLTVSHYYPQIEVESGSINFLANEDATSEEIEQAIANQFFDKVTLSGGFFELSILESTPTTVKVLNNTFVVIKENSDDTALSNANFDFGENTSLVLEKYFGENLHFNKTDGINVSQQNIKTAEALVDAVTYAQTIGLGSDITNDGAISLFENFNATKINLFIDTNGFDILCGIDLSSNIEDAQITITSSGEQSTIGGGQIYGIIVGINTASSGAENAGLLGDETNQNTGFNVSLNNLKVTGQTIGFYAANTISNLNATNCEFVATGTELNSAILTNTNANYVFENCTLNGKVGVTLNAGTFEATNSTFTATSGSAIVVGEASSLTLEGKTTLTANEFAITSNASKSKNVTASGEMLITSSSGAFNNITFDGNTNITTNALTQTAFDCDIANQNINLIVVKNGTFNVTLTDILADKVEVQENATAFATKFFDTTKLATKGGSIELCTSAQADVKNVLNAIENNTNYTKITLQNAEFDLGFLKELPETLSIVAGENAKIKVENYFEKLLADGGEISLSTTNQTALENAIKNQNYANILVKSGNFELALTNDNTTQTKIELGEKVELNLHSKTENVTFDIGKATVVFDDVFTGWTSSPGANITQKGVDNASELENAMTYASKIVLGSSILGRVELLSKVQANSTINVEIDLFGHDILTESSRLYVAENNQTEGISANITITSSNGNSYIGNRLENEEDESLVNNQAPYGLDIRGGNFRGSSTSIKGFNLCLNVSNVVLQGQYGGAVINGSYENTFNSETNEGFKLEVNFNNVTFNATTKEDIDTTTHIMYTPAGAYFVGKSILKAENCTFKGGTGLYVKAGNLKIQSSQILATEIPEDFTYKEPAAISDGYYGNGSAFVLDTHSSYAGPAQVEFDSVIFESTVGYAIDEYRSYGTVDGNPTITVLGATTVNNTALGFAKIASSGEVLSVGENVAFNNITSQALFEDAVKYASTINLACNLDYSTSNLEITKSINIFGSQKATSSTTSDEDSKGEVPTITGNVLINGAKENPVTVNLSGIKIEGQLEIGEYATVYVNGVNVTNTSSTAIVVKNGGDLTLWGGTLSGNVGIEAKQGSTVELFDVTFDVITTVATVETEEFALNNASAGDKPLVLNNVNAKIVVTTNSDENNLTITTNIAGATVLEDKDVEAAQTTFTYTLFEGTQALALSEFEEQLLASNKIALRANITLTDTLTISNDVCIVGFGNTIVGKIVVSENANVTFENVVLLSSAFENDKTSDTATNESSDTSTTSPSELDVLENNGTTTISGKIQITGKITNNGTLTLAGNTEDSWISGTITNNGTFKANSTENVAETTNSTKNFVTIWGKLANYGQFDMANASVQNIWYGRTQDTTTMNLTNVSVWGNLEVTTSGLTLKNTTTNGSIIITTVGATILSNNEITVTTTGQTGQTIWQTKQNDFFAYTLLNYATIGSADALKTALEDSSISIISLHGSFDLNEQTTISRDVILVGNGHTISGSGSFVITADATVTFERNVVLNFTSDVGVTVNGNLVINNAKITAKVNAVQVTENGELKATNATFESLDVSGSAILAESTVNTVCLSNIGASFVTDNENSTVTTNLSEDGFTFEVTKTQNETTWTYSVTKPPQTSN